MHGYMCTRAIKLHIVVRLRYRSVYQYFQCTKHCVRLMVGSDGCRENSRKMRKRDEKEDKAGMNQKNKNDFASPMIMNSNRRK